MKRRVLLGNMKGSYSLAGVGVGAEGSDKRGVVEEEEGAGSRVVGNKVVDIVVFVDF